MNELTKLAVGIMLLGLVPAVPTIDTILVNAVSFPNVAHNFLQAGLIIAGISFMYQAVRPR